MADPARAQELKAEGNALFVKGEYAAAHQKYEDAIQYDDRNAILYANRAACSIHLDKFSEAKADAKQAVELDPAYAKGWARMATACDGLGEYGESVKCWRKAMAALPKDNLTASDARQKKQCEDGLRTAAVNIAKAAGLVDMGQMRGKFPWDRVKAIENELHAGLPANAGSSALTDLTDAILTDSRIFRMEGSWMDMYNKQVMLETMNSGAWPALPMAKIQEEAMMRQQEHGWDAARLAVDVTIRIWLMQGFVASNTGSDTQTSLRPFNLILELLNWGQTSSWGNSSTKDKGNVFEDYFVRGVRKLRMEAMMAHCAKSPPQGLEAALKALYEEAQIVMQEVGPSLPEGEHEPGFVSAFGIYPKAHAYTAIGFYHQQTVYRYKSQRDYEIVCEHSFKAYQAYREAAMLFPKDDESRAWFIVIAFQSLQQARSTFKVALHVMEELRLALPETHKIWEFSQIAVRGKDKACKDILQLEQKMRKDLGDGRITLEDHMPAGYSLTS
ncbi:hypothetical protein EVJ58_g51 [Rhodofomes roseus]|uniref:Uncharacterized protein n=1 Tax=Rhodofomes roseus TaxID=34475 RepID=A0A4Y9Z876_9APHY|nr:hypothetical protein EVJ58_g51 [Rhodofomes roseus]